METAKEVHDQELALAGSNSTAKTQQLSKLHPEANLASSWVATHVHVV